MVGMNYYYIWFWSNFVFVFLISTVKITFHSPLDINLFHNYDVRVVLPTQI